MTSCAEPPSAPARLVLDTNAWLDLLVFRDPRVDELRLAVEHGRVRIHATAAMLNELERVLGYPTLALAAEERRRALDAARAVASLTGEVDGTPGALPRCRDPDDQMFLELAAGLRVDALLSRDADLLRLAPRMRRAGLCDIVEPEAWCRRAAAGSQISKR